MPGMTSDPSPRHLSASRPSAAWARVRRGCLLAWALAAWALSQSVGAAQPGVQGGAFGPLLTPAALLAQLPGVRVVDLREAEGADASYAAGHIPGAVSAPYAAWRGPADNPGELLPVARYVALVRSLGVDAQTPVVLVADGGDPSDFGAPARVYWTLKWLGVQHLAILNGGMAAWTRAGLPVTRQAARARPSRFTPRFDAAILATRAAVSRDVQDPRAALLLDARPRAFYLGRVKAPAAAKPGTLPGALDFDNARWFPGDSGALPDAAVLQRVAQGLPPMDPKRPVVSFCNTGHWAATNWFVLSEVLHRPDVKLYPGSMVDWSRAGEPMAHVPGRFEQLWTQLKQAWQGL